MQEFFENNSIYK